MTVLATLPTAEDELRDDCVDCRSSDKNTAITTPILASSTSTPASVYPAHTKSRLTGDCLSCDGVDIEENEEGEWEWGLDWQRERDDLLYFNEYRDDNDNTNKMTHMSPIGSAVMSEHDCFDAVEKKVKNGFIQTSLLGLFLLLITFLAAGILTLIVLVLLVPIKIAVNFCKLYANFKKTLSTMW